MSDFERLSRRYWTNEKLPPLDADDAKALYEGKAALRMGELSDPDLRAIVDALADRPGAQPILDLFAAHHPVRSAR